jgi:hypothetical protein
VSWWLRLILAFLAFCWLVAIFAAPLLNSGPLYALFSMICHQMPERSWHIHGEPLGVCIRCTSISFGFVIGVLSGGTPKAPWFKWALAISIGEWLLLDWEFLRALSGVALGLTAAPIVCAGVDEMLVERVGRVHESM